MAIREGRWDCSSCGSTAIYGRHVDCPGCGRPRPAGVGFYLADGEPVVTDPERLAQARAGADWICEHCQASNRATLKSCGGCGGARGGSPTQPVVKYAAGQEPRGGGPPEQPLGAIPQAPREERRQNPAGWFVGGVMAVAVVCGMIGECMAREPTYPPTAAVVEDARWERIVQVSTHGFVAGEGWELPDSAIDVRRETRVRGERQEVAGYYTIRRVQPRTVREIVGERKAWEANEGVTSCQTVNLGNGYFKRVCSRSRGSGGKWVMKPVYQTRTVYDTTVVQQPYFRRVPASATYYTYRVPEWKQTDTRRAAGDLRRPPAWPDTAVEPGQRTFRQARYQVIVRDARGNRQGAWMWEESWRKYRPGQRVAFARAGGDRYAAKLLPRDSLAECRRWHRGRGRPPPDSLGCSPRRG
jgi:hypothetical protein